MSHFTGMRKVTIRNNKTGETATYAVITPDKLGADGLNLSMEVNELTRSAFSGDITSPNGVNVGSGTLQVMPLDIADVGKIFPEGWDEATGTWQAPIGGCTNSDCTLAFEKVCDTKGNVILRHCQIATAFELALSRDDSLAFELQIYPSLQLGSVYGLEGDLEDATIAYQLYDGVYDPDTDEVAFDAAADEPSGD